MTYLLGQMIGPELLKREFKELCLQNIAMYFTSSELHQLIYNNKMVHIDRFNQMVLDMINQLIVKYLPKYIGNYSKAAISGEIIFGINDYGYVEGIPYVGDLTIDIVRNMIMSAMPNSRGVQINSDGSITYDSDIVKWYYQNLKIQIIKLSTTDDDTKTNHHRSIQLIKHYELKNQEYKAIWATFHAEYAKWHSILMRYSCKLLNYLLDHELKRELIEYISENFELDDSLDKSKLNDVLKFFDQSDDYFRSIVFTLDMIEEIINDDYSPIKWLVTFKDKCLKHIKKMKPRAPVSPVFDNDIYHRFANNVNNIRSQLLMSSDINFYVIRIIIPNMLDTYLEYRNTKFGSWVSKKRIDSALGPCCI